jgi:CheY-like chemotaxis protein
VLKDLDKIRNAGRHLLALINDVLDLSKIEAGKMQLDFDFIDLRALIEEVAATIKPLADHNGNRFEIKQPDSLVPLWADGMRLKQCLLNLLSNACKFTKAGTVTLDVHCERRGDGEVMMFDVRDTGIGIPPDKLDRLFQQFSQVDASTTRKFGGTGLGLAISRHFCRMMGGDISVTSAIDTGSIFSIALPIRGPGLANQMLAPAFDGTATPASDMALPAPGGMVLVIDDSENDRTLLRRHLEREGFDVITASSGVEGLALLRKHRPAAVTLDIKMDYIDGWTVLAAIRGDAELSAIPVIMVSILSEAERGRTMGAAGFVTKPIDRDQLVPLLEHLTGGGIVRRALVVDDDEASRTMLRRTLEARGWEVKEAENGRQALAVVAQECPDLIMLDLMMPEADGFEVVEALRGDAATASIPVLIVTAKELTDAERRRLSADVVGVLQKGIYTHADISRVMSAVKHALAARGGVETGLSNVRGSEELGHSDADADERI